MEANGTYMLSECFFQAALDFLLKSVPYFIEFELTKKLVIDECWRSRRISCSLLEDLVWCAAGGGEALRISLRGTLRKHGNLIIIDLDVFESWDDDENGVARLLAELLDRVLLEGHPVSLRALLVILELFLKPARQIGIDVLEKFANVVGGESSNLLQEIIDELGDLLRLGLEAREENGTAVPDDEGEFGLEWLVYLYPEIVFEVVDRTIDKFLHGLLGRLDRQC